MTAIANRTAVLVIAAAVAMLAASFALQSDRAMAGGGFPEAVEEIHSIGGQARSTIDAVVAAVGPDLDVATTEEGAKEIRDTARDMIGAALTAAEDDMKLVVERTDDAPEVEAAFREAFDSLDEHASAADDEIKALYDAWKFRYEAPPAEEVIAKIDEKLAEGLAEMMDDLERFAVALEDAGDLEEAGKERDEALERIAKRFADTVEDLDQELSDRPFDPIVVAAHAGAMSDLEAAAAGSEHTIHQGYAAWVAEHAPSATTTTTRPAPTTTTHPPVTTTTRPAPTTATTANPSTPTTLVPATTTTAPATTTTTTTLVASAQLPPIEPPRSSEVSWIADLPAPVILSAQVSAGDTGQAGTAALGFVRRVVDSELPPGISAVAAGPLVVLGLIFEAVRAAGALMLLPWLVLGIYIFVLLRNQHRPSRRMARPVCD